MKQWYALYVFLYSFESFSGYGLSVGCTGQPWIPSQKVSHAEVL